MNHDASILALIQKYQAHVADAVSLFRQMGIKGNILRAWRRSAIPTWADEGVNSDPIIPQRGLLSDARSIRYSFHGMRCCVEYGSVVVDFDFGPNGRFDGFDAWRLHLFAESFPEFSAFADIDLVRTCLSDLDESGTIAKIEGVVGSHLYYFIDGMSADISRT